MPDSRAIISAVRLRKSAAVVLTDRVAELCGSGPHAVHRSDRRLLGSGAESVLEGQFLALVHDSGLPRPTPQSRIAHGSGQSAGVDLLYVAERLVIELSGRLGQSTPSERAKNAQRRNELQALGYAVHEYTWNDVATRPRSVVATLRELLARRQSRTFG